MSANISTYGDSKGMIESLTNTKAVSRITVSNEFKTDIKEVNSGLADQIK